MIKFSKFSSQFLSVTASALPKRTTNLLIMFFSSFLHFIKLLSSVLTPIFSALFIILSLIRKTTLSIGSISIWLIVNYYFLPTSFGFFLEDALPANRVHIPVPSPIIMPIYKINLLPPYGNSMWMWSCSPLQKTRGKALPTQLKMIDLSIAHTH
jgi:hypothetical protein